MSEAAPAAVQETPAVPPPAEAAAPPPEAPEGEAAEEKAPDASKLLAALTRKKAKQRAEAAKLAQAKADFERQQAEWSERAKEIERIKTLAQRAREGDDEALAELGIDYDELTTRRLKRNTPDEKIGELKKQLEAERAARLEREKAAQEAQERAAAEQAVRAFVSLVQGGQYPESAMYEPGEIAAAGNHIAEEFAQRTGRYPDHATIAAELERRIAAKHAAIRGVQAKAPPPAPEKPKKGETITNRDAGERGQAPRELSEEEKRELFARFAKENIFR